MNRPGPEQETVDLPPLRVSRGFVPGGFPAIIIESIGHTPIVLSPTVAMHVAAQLVALAREESQ